MTIHKALCELKVLDSRISTAIMEDICCNANKASNEKIGGLGVDEYKELIKARHSKALDLIKRRDAIKRAVVLSNAITKVSINNVEYTVAEAIEMKNHGMKNYKSLLNTMLKRFGNAQATIDRENGRELEERADNYIVAMYGSKENKTNADEIAKVKAEFIKNNQYELIDPLNIEQKTNELSEYISNFETEVDSALSVSNALTEIEVEY